MKRKRKAFERKGIQKLFAKYTFFNNRYQYALLYQLSAAATILNCSLLLVVFFEYIKKETIDFRLIAGFYLIVILKKILKFSINKKIESRKICLDSFSEIADFFDQTFLTEAEKVSCVMINTDVLPELSTAWKKRIGLIHEMKDEKDETVNKEIAEYEDDFINDIELSLSVNFMIYMIPVSLLIWKTIPMTFPVSLTRVIFSLLITGWLVYAELRAKYNEYFTFFSPQICLYKLLEDFQYMEMVESICAMDKQLPAVIKNQIVWMS